MKTQELRIGNLVHYKYGEDEYNAVTALDEEGNVNIDTITGFGVMIDELEGIKLNEEWLSKLDFKKNKDGTFENKLIIEYSIYKECYVVHNVIFAKLKYVHQLQNLYFALTNKEL